MNTDAIFDAVLQKVKPTEPILPKIQPVLDAITQSAKENNVDVTVQCGGSTAKDTYLATSHDCDVFVKFNYNSYKEYTISETLCGVLDKTPYDFTQVHGSRDYYQATIDGVDFEIIPVFDISKPEDALNVTDTSPMHVNWVVERTKGTTLTDDIRLTKQFCKAQKVYGAESYIGGFSGHIIDILVIHYNGFVNLLKASQNWDGEEIIDPMKFYEGKNALDFLNESKIDSPLIIIDPILNERNAASALTKKRWNLFREAAKSFLAEPSIDFFEFKEMTKSDFGENAFQITLTPHEGKSDIVGGRCKKTYEYILTKAKENGFEITDSDWEFNEKQTNLFYVTKVTELDEIEVIRGPPLKMKGACDEFKKRKDGVYEKDNFIWSNKKRLFTSFQDFLQAMCESEYVLERVKSAQLDK